MPPQQPPQMRPRTIRDDVRAGPVKRMLCTDPADSGAWMTLGQQRLRQGLADDALGATLRGCRLAPDDARVRAGLALLLMRLGRLAEAAQASRVAIALDPADPLLHKNHASFVAAGGVEAIARPAGRAAAIAPDDVDALVLLSGVQLTLRRYGEAEATLRRALRVDPRAPAALGNLGLLIAESGYPETGLQLLEQAHAAAPDNPVLASNLLYHMNYTVMGEDAIVARHRDVMGRSAGRRATIPTAALPIKADAPIVVGFVSPDFRAQAVASFFEPVLDALDRNRVTPVCYSCSAASDHVTERLRAKAALWRDISRMPDAEAAALVAGDGVSILVDLRGHGRGNRLGLFRHRPAPLQLGYLGYPGSTGLAEMDGRITDLWADPPGFGLGERLLRLDGGFLCFRAPDGAPDVAIPGDGGRPLTFGSYSNLSRLSSRCLQGWARVLDAVPDSRLRLKYSPLSDPWVRRRLDERLKRHGIDPGRVDMAGHSPLAEHLAEYGLIDIVLDSWPSNGFTTTCDALWMGVPVVSWAGRRHASRVGLSILRSVGLADLCAEDEEDWVGLAVRLARDSERRSRLREGMRQRVAGSALMDLERFGCDLDRAFRRALARS